MQYAFSIICNGETVAAVMFDNIAHEIARIISRDYNTVEILDGVELLARYINGERDNTI